MPVTWKNLLAGLKQFEKSYQKYAREQHLRQQLSKEDRQVISKLAIESACAVLSCTPKELDLLSGAFASNAQWMLSGVRDKELAKACENARTLTIMQDLFAQDQTKELGFVTRTYYIKKKLSLTGRGLDWDGSQRIVRIRKNKIMNWATDSSALSSSFTNNEPVLLVPVADLSSRIVLVVGPQLVLDCSNYANVYKHMRKSMNSSIAIDFWGDLLGLCYAVATMQHERECFTYGERVPCNVFRLDSGKSIGHPVKAPRRPI